MCGFLGEFLFKKDTFISEKVFSNLLELSKHRGPDDTQVFQGENYRLGFNRLSILDLSTNGSQPKQSSSKRYHVVFNGEIYNYKALAEQYELKNLKSTSDTEVLVSLLDVLGVKETVALLNGMFAIMIVDTQTNDIYLVRDFAGIKPLFYGVSEKGLVTASQFNQVFKHPWFSEYLELRADVMKGYFSLGYMLAPDTIYRNIYQVRPGELLQIDAKGCIKKEAYLQFGEAQRNQKDSEPIHASKLNIVVKNQMVSDVSLGSFLSGGIDSPLVTAVAYKSSPKLQAYTLAVDHKKLDETEKAKDYVKYLKIKHHFINISQPELLNVVETHFKYMTEPFGDYSSIPTFAVSKGAKVNNTVMLSGDGGDELFFGYPRMLHIIKLRHWFKIPFQLRKPLVRIAIKTGFLNSWAPYNFRDLSHFVKAKQSYINEESVGTFFNNQSYTAEVENIFDFNNQLTKFALLKKLRVNEFYGHLQRVLVKVDRMSMANSLEVRVPLLDKEILNNAFNWQPSIFKLNTDLKKPLKSLLQTYYPKKLINQEKKGFAVPISDWLHGELKKDVEDVVLAYDIYGNSKLKESELKRYVSDFLDYKHKEAWGVWHIYAWQKWAINEGLI